MFLLLGSVHKPDTMAGTRKHGTDWERHYEAWWMSKGLAACGPGRITWSPPFLCREAFLWPLQTQQNSGRQCQKAEGSNPPGWQDGQSGLGLKELFRTMWRRALGEESLRQAAALLRPDSLNFLAQSALTKPGRWPGASQSSDGKARLGALPRAWVAALLGWSTEGWHAGARGEGLGRHRGCFSRASGLRSCGRAVGWKRGGRLRLSAGARGPAYILKHP